MYMRAEWEDERIRVLNGTEDFWGQKITLDNYWTEQIWLPDLFVYHMEKLETLKLLQPFKSK